MAEGTVKWFNEKKGFGFIIKEEGGDIFFHYSAIEMSGFRTVKEGDRVSYEEEDTDRGPQAKNIKRVED